MRTKPKLPRDWSWPISATEREDRLPDAAAVDWEMGTLRQFEGAHIVFRARWDPTSKVPQPVLTIRAVPSCHRSAIREAFDESMAEAVATWLGGVSERPATWLSETHYTHWTWTPPS
jgi:hypothetical protein